MSILLERECQFSCLDLSKGIVTLSCENTPHMLCIHVNWRFLWSGVYEAPERQEQSYSSLQFTTEAGVQPGYSR